MARRELLRAGGLGLGVHGLGLPELLRARASAPAGMPSASFGKAKACILLYLYGSPSQL